MAEGVAELKSQYEAYIQQAMAIVDAAEKRGLHIRVLGAIATLIHCGRHREMLVQMSRVLTDIDFMALSSQDKEIELLFKDLGYTTKGGGVTIEIWKGRMIFTPPQETGGPAVDVFFDKLDFCHTIDFTKRLEIDKPTISLSDLLLEKLQIVEINEKDLKDVIVILMEHEISETEAPEHVNAGYIAQVLSREWGFYYTAKTNFQKVDVYLDKYDVVSDQQRQLVRSRIAEIMRVVEAYEKPLSWKVRARIGTRVKWYKDVAEEYRNVGL